MSNAAKRASATDNYLATIESLEPHISSIDAGAFYASAAISLKRIADSLEIISAELAQRGALKFTP